MTADYSQIEMRIMAHLSKDDGLIEAFRTGEDLHSFVASRAFGVPIDGVTAELRRRVKAMSYGLAYGLSAHGLAAQLKISTEEAKVQMEQYFSRFGGVRDYLEGVVDQARRTATPRRCWAAAATCPNSTAATGRSGRPPSGRRSTPDPGQRGGHHQGRDDQRRHRAAGGGPGVADAAAGATSCLFEVAPGEGRGRGAGARADGQRLPARCAARGRRWVRPQLG